MFKNMKISTRLTLAFTVMVLITLTISVLSYIRMGLMNQTTGKIVVDLYPQTKLANDIISNVNQISLEVRNALLFIDTQMIKNEIGNIRDNQKKNAELINQLESKTETGKGRELINKIKESRQKFNASLDKVIELGGSDGAAATQYLINDFRGVNAEYLGYIDDLINYQGELMRQGGNDSMESFTTSRNFLIVMTVFSALLSALLGFWIIRAIIHHLNRAVEVASAVSQGDLTSNIEVKTRDEVGQLLQALKDMNASLGSIVGEVRSTTESISTAAQQIATGNNDLSQRTEQQASSLEETASSMEELTSTVKQNAENAKQANQLAANASDIAVKGGQVVNEVVHTMGSISASSRKIMDIISVIEGIAFQTNILALNAAVEAARAGEQGRGFAVVAAEVRNLAQRSAAAAKEITALIEDSVDKVDTGSRQVDQAGATMNEIVSAVKRVTDIMSEIAAASSEQSSGIEQVNQALVQMDEVTQQNAALVEEAAASAEAMQEQARALYSAVGVFKVVGGREAAVRLAAKTDDLKADKPAITQRVPAHRTRAAVAPYGKERRTKPRLNATKEVDEEEWKEF
jgi:methyl-accepting chemotaxis protein